MPSWYVTFLVTFALICCDRYQKSANTSALLFAGACLGLAMAIKITALYAIAGVVIGLSLTAPRSIERPRGSYLVLFVLFVLLLLVGMLMLPHLTVRSAAHILAPPIFVTGWAIAAELLKGRRHGLSVGGPAIRAWIVFTAGIIIGMLPWLAWLGWSGALAPFVASVAQVGGIRAGSAAYLPPPTTAIGKGLLLVVAVWIGVRYKPVRWPLVVLGSLMVFWYTWQSPSWHRNVWQTLRGVLPIGIVALTLIGGFKKFSNPRWVLPACVTAWMVLSQFPFAAPIYFVYLIPLLVLLVLTLEPWHHQLGRVVAGFAVGLALFGATQLVPGNVRGLGSGRAKHTPLARLATPRGGLQVPSADSTEYAQLLKYLMEEVGEGAIWAGPDSPEVAYLAQRRDANRYPFLFLAGEDNSLESLWDSPLAAVVVLRDPDFSRPLPDEIIVRVVASYPVEYVVGRFTVYSPEP
jgi:hypothetical protein